MGTFFVNLKALVVVSCSVWTFCIWGFSSFE